MSSEAMEGISSGLQAELADESGAELLLVDEVVAVGMSVALEVFEFYWFSLVLSFGAASLAFGSNLRFLLAG